MFQKFLDFVAARDPITDADWQRPSDDDWYDFMGDGLPDLEDLRGVYIIFYETGESEVTVYVGEGDLNTRIPDHRNEPKITNHHTDEHPLKVTWCKNINENAFLGVESFLQTVLASRENDPEPVRINLPF